MTLVSVVIPAHNAQDWISDTIESVLGQSYKDIEVIVVDDGSTDRTVDKANQSLRDGPFHYRILGQENAGPSAARNRGWQAARGKWVQFLDADDILDSSKIELQANHMCGADIIYSDWQRIRLIDGAWKREIHVETPLIGQNPLADILKPQNFIALGSQLFRLDKLAKVGGFEESHRLIEDVELHIKIAAANGVFVKACSNRPLFWYRDHPSSLSKSDRREFVEGCIRNAKMVEQCAREMSNRSAEIIDAVVDVYYQGARYFAERDPIRFEQLVTELESLRPMFSPRVPFRLNVLSRVVGYRHAERTAIVYRKIKRLATGLWDGFGSRRT